jgi:hypothetical protein
MQLRGVHHGPRLGQRGRPLVGVSACPIHLRQQPQKIRLEQRRPRGQLGGEPLSHRGQGGLALALHGQGPAMQERTPGQPGLKPLLRCQGRRGRCLLVR